MRVTIRNDTIRNQPLYGSDFTQINTTAIKKTTMAKSKDKNGKIYLFYAAK